MKKLLTLTLVLLVFAGTAFGQTKNAEVKQQRFIKMMESNIAKLDAAKEISEMQELANLFERVGNVEKENWLPNYYAAYSYVNMAFMIAQSDMDKVDVYLDKADELIDKAAEMAGEDSEITVLKAYSAQARISVDPMSRGQKYGPLAGGLLMEAEKQNPNNPRAPYLNGISKFYTPEMWGGGKANACPLINQAAELFEKFEPASSIHPNWGSGPQLDELMKKCSE